MNKSRVLCKICGIKDFSTAQLAARLGSDFIGMHAIWRVKSEDLVSFIKIAHDLPKEYSVKAVLVTRQQDINTVVVMVEQVKPAYIQLHAPWSRERIIRLRAELNKKGYQGVQLIGVVGLKTYKNLPLVREIIGAVDLLLLDSSFRGGTGHQADPLILKKAVASAGSTPVLIAGGLTPENVGGYIQALHPFGVDIQTGVDYPDRPGIKDPKRIAAFLQAVRSVKTVA